MEINKEEALRLWKAQFGKAIAPCDYAGRKINKASYNDRNSQYGWNIDHILPQSRGGKTADYNLICCHIQTNSEKADKFPCFKANGQEFEIRKRQNHYEIFSRTEQEDEDDSYNLMDSAQGMVCWKDCNHFDPYRYVQYVKIRIKQQEYSKTFMHRFENFLQEVFPGAAVFGERRNTFIFPNVCQKFFTVIRFNAPLRQDSQDWLDNCILLNTYTTSYLERKYGCTIRMHCGMLCYDAAVEVGLAQIERDIQNLRSNFNEHLAIDELIKDNSNAGQEITWPDDSSGFYHYNHTYKNLRKSLEKLV